MADDTTLPEGANVDPTDEIADLLAGDDDEKIYQETSEQTSTEQEEAENEEEESTKDAEDSDNEHTEESTEEDESNDENGPDTWAEALGVDEHNVLLDDTGNFAGVNIKVDGSSSTVELKELIVGYQTNKHNTNTSKALADDRRQFEAVRDNAVSDYTTKLENVSKLSEYMHKSLLSDYEGVDWQTLRSQDPAEYAAAYQDFERRKQEIQNIYSAIETERATESTSKSDQTNLSKQAYLKGELGKVMANNPEWNTPDKLKSEFSKLGSFVDEAYGIDSNVFNALGDARYIEVIKDAMAYRKGKEQVVEKRRQKLPKFQKSKSRGAKQNKVSKLDKLTKAAKGASGGQKRDLEVNAVAELLTGI